MFEGIGKVSWPTLKKSKISKDKIEYLKYNNQNLTKLTSICFF